MTTMLSVVVDDEGCSVYSKYMWHDDSRLMFRVKGTKRLVEYKWSDIEKGIYDQGKYVHSHDDKVADACIDDQVLAVLWENGKFQLSPTSKVMIAESDKLVVSSWHAIKRLQSSDFIICGVNNKVTKWTNVIALVDLKGVVKSIATIEMESNDGNIRWLLEWYTIEKLLAIKSSTKASLMLAINNMRYVNVVAVRRESVVAIINNIDVTKDGNILLSKIIASAMWNWWSMVDQSSSEESTNFAKWRYRLTKVYD